MIFETHAHYDDEAFESDRDTLLKSIKENGVGRIVNVCASLESLENTKELMERFPFIYGAFGLHPDEVGDLNEDVLNQISLLCREEKAVAVGEIGLDYYWNKEQQKRQIYWFERQMELAREEKLPIIVHSRDAASDTLDTMKRVHAEEIGGVCHCFSYPKEIAREYINMGFCLGIGGVVTFNNAKKLKEVVAYAPLDRILLETDSPYLSPVPYRGKRNSSLNLPYIAQMISEIKKISYEEVIAVTEKNAEKLFLGENL